VVVAYINSQVLSLCDQTKTFRHLVDQGFTTNFHAIATQALHCSDMLNEGFTWDATTTFSHLVDQDVPPVLFHYRSLHSYETNAQRWFHYSTVTITRPPLSPVFLDRVRARPSYRDGFVCLFVRATQFFLDRVRPKPSKRRPSYRDLTVLPNSAVFLMV
jgi:hypothetical protein